MCVEISKSNSHLILRKSKLDGHVEAISIAPWERNQLAKVLQNIVSLSPATIKIQNYLIRYPKHSKYVSIKDKHFKHTIFIPIEKLGFVITQLLN